MNEKDVTCCFSGYRPKKLPWLDDESDPRCADLKRRLYEGAERAYQDGYRYFVCGMAQGCDMYFCEAILGLKKKYGGIILEAAIPCEGQAGRWSGPLRKRYLDLLEKCDLETLVQKEYTQDCMARRNRYMVDKSSLLIAVYDGAAGGTMYTVEYARRRGLRVVELLPAPSDQLNLFT